MLILLPLRICPQSGFLTMFPFDPLNMKSERTQLNEVKNGRLAMIAFIGFCSQAAVNGEGPIEALTRHLADPGHNNSEFNRALVWFCTNPACFCIPASHGPPLLPQSSPRPSERRPQSLWLC